MYAKLVTGGSAVIPSLLIRDIIALCTSATPSLSNLSGSGFSTTSSVVVDNTPAGWTYVHSSLDGSTLGSGSTPSASSYDWWAMKSPCLAPAGKEKFAVINTIFTDSTTHGGFWLAGASNVVTTTITNRGSYGYAGGTATATTLIGDGQNAFSTVANQTFHLIATPRFILIIKEGVKYHGVFEHSATELHEFYNVAPFCQLNIGSNTYGPGAASAGSLGGVQINGTVSVAAAGNTHNFEIFNFTDPNTNINYGVLSFGGPGESGLTAATSLAQQPFIWSSRMSATLSATGATRNIVKPMIFQGFGYGLPTCWITGISDVWFTRGSAGTTGDTMIINGDTYTYFNAISSAQASGNKTAGFVVNTGQTA
jgi:hypothetical protein